MNEEKKNRKRGGTEEGTVPHRRSVPEWLALKLDFPPDILTGGMRIELRGRNSLLVHGCRKILHYAPDEMRLCLWDCVLRITGDGLVCHSYLAGAVGIEGNISGLFFETE